MVKSLNFNSIQKQYLPVTFADEKQTKILVGTPTKAIMREMLALQALEDNVDDETQIDELFEACAKIMSRNKGGVKITVEFLESVMDFEDIKYFFAAYQAFLGELASSKN